ncbi:MAG: efflux transporter outer membrane subunit [Rubrivivax sp.]
MPSPILLATASHPGRRCASAALAGAVLSLAGCASLQQPLPASSTADLTPPAQWSSAAPAAQAAGAGDEAALLAWWRRFDDPLLDAAIDDALAHATDLDAAQARLRQARAQRDLALAGTRPNVGGSGSARVSRAEGGANGQSYGIGVDASWEPDLWGGQAAGVAAADASAQASAATLAATRLAVAAEAALDLLQWRGTLARLTIARASLESQRQTLQIVQWRAEAGLVTQLDVEQARTGLAQTEAQVPALEAAAAQTRHAFETLAGRPPGSWKARFDAAAAASQPEAPAALALAMPADVLRQRPDVRAAERQLAAAAARVEQADAARLPSLNLGGSIGLSALRLSRLASGAGVATLLASIDLPLFDGGRRVAQVRVQEAARDEAAAAWRASVLGALQDVEDTLVALDGTQAQLASQRTAAAAAQRAADLADQRYRSGLVDFQNVLQTQRTRLAAQDAVASTTAALNALHVRLYKALGGGWTPATIDELARAR